MLVYGECEFRPAYVVCILWQFSVLSLLMLVEDAKGDHMEGDLRKEPARWRSLL